MATKKVKEDGGDSTETVKSSKPSSLDIAIKAINKKHGDVLKYMCDKPLIINTCL